MAPPRIANPRDIPVVAVDSQLPAVAPERLRPAALRARFAQARALPAEFGGDAGAHLDARPLARAAVLVPLVEREGGLHVLLTRRTDHLRDHAGQIAFPGGRAEERDADAAATALREAEEEVGLVPARVDVIGRMPTSPTVTRYIVTPIIALIQPPPELAALALDRNEVAEAFEVPLAFLMDPAHHRRHRYEYEGGSRHFLSMPWEGRGSDGQWREYFIWGATAAMLRNLYRVLAE
ncbi:MAG: CoA pyrophosphatase [Burkholderiales bacterium]|nr:CoA pyrophosphatase [Burkholderiales bacterium]